MSRVVGGLFEIQQIFVAGAYTTVDQCTFFAPAGKFLSLRAFCVTNKTQASARALLCSAYNSSQNQK